MDQQQQSRRRLTRTQVTWIGIGVVAGLFAAIVVFGGYYFEWKWTGYPKRTPWDWMDLLIVPVVLAIGGYLFTRSENRATQAAAERRAQEEALQAYLDNMSDMLIPNKDQPSLYKARSGDSLSFVARAQTLTVLPRLDGNRKARIVQFLFESGLIDKDHPILDLSGADLTGADLSRAQLYGTSGVNLSKADLSGANLSEAELSVVYVTNNIYQVEADLSEANLSEADLSGANLSGANPRGANLSRVTLTGATMPNGQKYEDWLKSKNHEQDGKNDGSS